MVKDLSNMNGTAVDGENLAKGDSRTVTCGRTSGWEKLNVTRTSRRSGESFVVATHGETMLANLSLGTLKS